MSDPTHKAVAVIDHFDPERLSPVVRAGMAILQQSPSAETLRELLAVQREYEAGEARRAYTVALVALKRDMPTVIARDIKVDFTGKSGIRTQYRHASLAAVMDAVTPALTQHGFSLAWEPATEGSNVKVTCRLTHAQGHHQETTVHAPVDNSGNKSPAQGVASTITLLSRYTACALLGIATADMAELVNDGEAPDPGKIDSALNLKKAGQLKRYGKTVTQAEAHVGRRVAEWTAADLDKLRAWIAPPTPTHGPRTSEIATPKDTDSAARLVEALDVIDKARSAAELKSIGATLKKIKMAPADLILAREAFKHRQKEVEDHG